MRLALAALLVVGVPGATWAQAAPEWRLMPVATIGGSEASDDRVLFDQVPWHGIAGRADGHIFLLDVRGTRVLEYDATGRHVRAIGRAGEGPGELRFPYALTIGPGDSLWVSDVLRYSVFTPAGRMARGGTIGARTFDALRVSSRGMVQALALTPGGGTGSLIPDQIRLARFDRRGAVTDTLWHGPAPRRVPVTVQIERSSFSISAIEQFGVSTHWDLLPDGTLVVADTTAYLLRLLSPSGERLRTIGPGTAGRRVTPADRERALNQIRKEQQARVEQLRSRGVQRPPELWRKQLEATPFGAVVQSVTGVRVDGRGRIWVGVAGTGAQPERIDVFNAQGTLQGRIMRPPAMPAALYGNGLAAFVERDADDAQRLVIMRVVE